MTFGEGQHSLEARKGGISFASDPSQAPESQRSTDLTEYDTICIRATSSASASIRPSLGSRRGTGVLMPGGRDQTNHSVSDAIEKG